MTGWHLFGAKEPTAKTDMIFRGVLYVKQLQLKDKKAGGNKFGSQNQKHKPKQCCCNQQMLLFEEEEEAAALLLTVAPI